MKKVGIVVVTFNRIEYLKKNIDYIIKLRQKTGYKYALYIIDNLSTDGTFDYATKLCETYNYINYIRLNENTGGAGGFYYGIKTAYNDGADFILGMDDDAYIDKNCLYHMLTIYEMIDKECCLFANSNNDKNFQNEKKEVKNWIFVGFFIPKEIISKVGLPRKEFFIYHDDVEYSFRIIKAGYKIYKLRDAVVYHRIDGVKMLPTKRFIFWQVKFCNLPDWKLYYFIRNIILKYKPTYYRYYICLLKACVYVLKIIILNPKQFKIAIKALFDGIIRKSGKVLVP